MVFLMVDVAVACEEDVMYQQEPELPLPLPGGGALFGFRNCPVYK